MKVVIEMDSFAASMNNSWSGATEVCREIYKQHRVEDAMSIIEEIFADTTPTITQLNDFIWFELADIMHLYDDSAEGDD